jgi:signal transduction histidine kinase
VSIRKTLLLAFVTVGLLTALVLAGLAFVQARRAVQTEIERSLGVQATSISAEVDKMVFERLQNAATWSRLDVMQDLQVQDVDKRLSHFLSDLQSGYGDVYLKLSGVDNQGRVVSSSDASSVGSYLTAAAPTYQVALAGAHVSLLLAGAAGSRGATMLVPVPSTFHEGTLGQLRLELDWTQVHKVLDLAGSGDGRMVAILDRGGKVVAASARLRQLGNSVNPDLAAWARSQESVAIRHSDPLDSSDVIVGSAPARGYARFDGWGWTTLVIQPVDQAFQPIHRMALSFLALLVVIIGMTVLVATWVSRKIAEPIAALTRFTRGYARNKAIGVPPDARGGEVGELTKAFVSMIRDIVQTQQNLVRASKLAVVGEMSAVIAHEVRTPLGILRSSAQMLRREAGISEEGRELVGFIDSETDRLNRLVSAMLDTARPRAAARTTVDMHTLIHRSIAMLGAQAEKKGVVVSERPAASNAVVQCDHEQMTQVLLNILMNGLQILEHGGHIDVSTHDTATHLRIDIADDGPGIDPAQRAQVFEAFFFQREGGIGLGLAIVQQIVIAHGGEIEAGESTLGGALFRILLPREPAGAP